MAENRQLAAPFAEIFASWEEAQWSFDLMRELLTAVGIVEPDDARFAVTWPNDYTRGAIHVMLGEYLIVAFRAPGYSNGTLDVTFADDLFVPEAWVKRYRFKSIKNRPMHVYSLNPDNRRAFLEQHREPLRESVRGLFAEHKTLKRSGKRIDHIGRIGHAIFDPEWREEVLQNGVGSLSFQQAMRRHKRAVARDAVAHAERVRQEIVTRFPRSDWPEMPLERYALGLPQSRESYSRWIEFASTELGSIKGGSARKHLVYKRKSKPGWYHHSRYADEQEAWAAVRGDIVEMFALAEQGRWAEIDSLPALYGGRTVRTKTLYVYFPDQVLPVYSHSHLQHFLKTLGAWREEMKQFEVVQLNRALWEVLNGFPEMAEWSGIEKMRLLYAWGDPRRTQRIVKIAPGRQAMYWNDCEANGYICVGWDSVGDLREYESFADFREAFAVRYAENGSYDQGTATRKAKELWTLMELQEGDRVVANRGISEVLAVGTVTADGYAWSEEREKYRHCVAVEWDTSHAKTITPQRGWGVTTVAEISAELFQEIIRSEPDPHPPLPVPPLFERMAESLERKGQAILFGPPGTGKTYHARQFALWWLLTQMNDDRAARTIGSAEMRHAVERELTTGQSQQRVWWVVANPKEWKWDTLFQDGSILYRHGRLRKNYTNVQPGDLVVGYQSTPDKRIMALARVRQGLHTVQNELKIELEPIQSVHNGLSYAELKEHPVLSQSEPMRYNCQGTLFALNEDEAELLFAELAERDPQFDPLMTDSDTVSPLTWVTFHPSYSYEDFVEGFRPKETPSGNGLVLTLEDGLFKRICRTAQANPEQPYLIIIDEINRANLGKVFGELITLLERDKRGLTITLPQSRESFAVPPNVHLLGTMNTADRSIKLMDSALRRRFAFLEMMPDERVLQGYQVGELELDTLLLTLNRRITQREGREKQLGHALFMANGGPVHEEEEFGRLFRQDIVPLLQEYCYDDYLALADLIGDELVDADHHTFHEAYWNDEELITALAKVTAT